MGIKRLIREGENNRIDFKKTITNNSKIAKTLVAFANSKGGSLLIGVADDGTIAGVKQEEEEKYMISKAAREYCYPIINPTFEEIIVDDKLVLIAHISESEKKPHFALDNQLKWWAYIRVADESVLASKIVVDVLKQGNNSEGVLISYSDSEKKLLTFLSEHGKITLKQFSKLLRCSNKKAQKILVNLIVTKVIVVHSSSKEEYFTAANKV